MISGSLYELLPMIMTSDLLNTIDKRKIVQIFRMNFLYIYFTKKIVCKEYPNLVRYFDSIESSLDWP